jgi:aminoglycoside 3-N-acetyltransferase I
MAESDDIRFHVIAPGETQLLEEMLTVFGAAFDDPDSYNNNRPSTDYLEKLLSSSSFIALAAIADGRVAGALAAYELRKFEQARSEIYIYDLAVDEQYRRRGIATGLILELKRIAASRGAYVMFVQADVGDEPAIQLYTSLGRREEVLHFDISVE